jgi:uncharacterized protein involved in outer membrane biogenesis
VKFFQSKGRVAFVLAVVLLGLFLFRPGANGLRRRIAGSISLALGRKVDVGWVKARLLPQPGFDLENFVVHDDPAYGAEPMLRAEEVTATLRLRSLLRGRLEIGRLSLKEPSFNLVRNEDGHWNLEGLLEKAAHTPAAPTSNLKPEARPVFPYIEADNGRINFKIGQEKKAYALTDADFALWLESDNEWGMRLSAQPVRADFNLTDTGLLRVNGTWQRSASLRETPLRFTLFWDRAQLGQFTKLIYGNDKGWRGSLTLNSTLIGTPGDLAVTADVAVQDFRRYDIVSAEPLRLRANCGAHYSSVEHSLSQIICLAPVGNGVISVGGSIASPTGPRTYDLDLVAQDLPLQSLVELARRARKHFPENLVASGMLSADFALQSTREKPELVWTGKGETADARVRSADTNTELNLGRIPFALASPRHNGTQHVGIHPAEKRLELGPFPLALGKSSVANIQGWLDRSNYTVSVQGNASVQRLLQVARLIGLYAPEPTADGAAKLDLRISGSWEGLAPPEVTGWAQLHSVRAVLGGLGGPVEIVSAGMVLSESAAELRHLAAFAAGSQWSGMVTVPRRCEAASACPLRFDLQTDSIAWRELKDFLSPRVARQPWYRFLSRVRQPGPSAVANLNAVGRISTKRLLLPGLAVRHLVGRFEIHDGLLRVSELTGELLGGTHHGEFEANLHATPPTLSGNGTFDRIALNQLAEVMHDGWIAGSAQGTYKFTASGRSAKELLENASGTLAFDAREGMLPHLELSAGGGPLHMRRFAGHLAFHDSTFEIREGKLETPSGIYQVSGTASLGQKLQVKLTRGGGQAFNVTGTLSAPRVLPATTGEQAALKP